MDYIFFAFSALCLGFVVLLSVLLVNKHDQHLSLKHLLLALAAALIYYFLETSFFRQVQTLYYVGNLLPQLLLLAGLAIYLWRQDHG